MPIYLRQIEPVNVGRRFVTADQRFLDSGNNSNNLVSSQEEACNRTLANIIRQLSSLGKHASDIFVVLEAEADVLVSRTRTLQRRVQDVGAKLTNLVGPRSPSHDDASSEDGFSCRHKLFSSSSGPDHLQPDGPTATAEWQSVVELDAGLFSRASRPLAVQELYLQCDGVPKVDIMQPYRDDAAICAKLYSDPGMFFDLWRKSMLEMAHKAKQYKRSKSRKKANQNQVRKVVQVTKIMTNADRIREREAKAGNITLPRAKSVKKDALARDAGSKAMTSDPPRKSSFSGEGRASLMDVPPPQSYPDDMDDDDNTWDFPPPPPSPPASPAHTDFRFDSGAKGVLPDKNPSIPAEVPKPAALPPPTPSAPAPPPPPPPPPGGSSAPPPPPPAAMSPVVETAPRADTNQRGNLLQQIKEGAKLKKVDDVEPKPTDDRSTLLTQIRQGKQLKQVKINEKREGDRRPDRNLNNVADIIALVMEQRFAAVGHSSDSDSESDDGDDFEDNDFSDG